MSRCPLDHHFSQRFPAWCGGHELVVLGNCAKGAAQLALPAVSATVRAVDQSVSVTILALQLEGKGRAIAHAAPTTSAARCINYYPAAKVRREFERRKWVADGAGAGQQAA